MQAASRARSFGAIAAEYDRVRPGPPIEAADWLLPEDAGRVAEIGAGTGIFTRQLLERVSRVIAIEPDLRMSLVLARRANRAQIVGGLAESIPLADASVDAVVGSSMWHWVDEALAAAEAARVLRPGGTLGLLWAGPDRTVPWVSELMSEANNLTGEQARGHERRRRHEVHLPPNAPFGVPETRLFRSSSTTTPDELVRLAGTYSRLAVLPAQERERRLGALAQLIGRHPALAGRSEVEAPLACIAWRARRL